MKEILCCYEIVRKLEVPDECPTDDYDSMEKWFDRQGKEELDYLIKKDTREREITDVEQL